MVVEYLSTTTTTTLFLALFRFLNQREKRAHLVDVGKGGGENHGAAALIYELAAWRYQRHEVDDHLLVAWLADQRYAVTISICILQI